MLNQERRVSKISQVGAMVMVIDDSVGVWLKKVKNLI